MVIHPIYPFKMFARLMDNLDGLVDKYIFNNIMQTADAALAIESLLEHINIAPDTRHEATDLISF